jgi:integrase
MCENAITPMASKIINYYSGDQGYIFPFTMNNKKWNLTNADQRNHWEYGKQTILMQINKFLKKAANKLHIQEDDFSLYTFRHSAITHEIQANKKPLMQIAKEAGTSVAMLENYYYHLIQEQPKEAYNVTLNLPSGWDTVGASTVL